MDKPFRPRPAPNEITSLSMVKYGFAVADEVYQHLLDVGLLTRKQGQWMLTETGTLWEAIGYW